MPLARKMSGARLGIVGMGRIGQAIAQRAAAFGMSIAYTARSAKAGIAHRYLPSPVALAAESDFLVLITPGGAGTRKLINAEVLAALGKGRGEGILVNVARGSVVDEAALIEALEQGVIAGAGLDVFENEPHVPERLRAAAARGAGAAHRQRHAQHAAGHGRPGLRQPARALRAAAAADAGARVPVSAGPLLRMRESPQTSLF